ncbi:MAG: hypothetical protein ACXVCP_17965 [Bdellovibrio sp.]
MKKFFNKSVTGTLMLVALLSAGCAKNQSNDVRVAGRNGIAAQGALNGVPTTCTSDTQSWGKIFDPYASSQFEYQVKNFVSATLDPQSLGTISGNIYDSTGIDFQGSFKFDAQGNLVKESSTVLIKIVDSFVKQVFEGQVVQPYVVEFKAADYGMINRNTRQFEVRFRDSYGDIVFKGNYNDQLAEGTVTYANNTAVDGYSPASGTLGNFRAYTCSLIK